MLVEDSEKETVGGEAQCEQKYGQDAEQLQNEAVDGRNEGASVPLVQCDILMRLLDPRIIFLKVEHFLSTNK